MNDKALKIIRTLPKITLKNTANFKNTYPKQFPGLREKKRGLGHRGYGQFQSWPAIGLEGNRLPWYLKVPIENIYDKKCFQRQLVRISLLDVQRMIDLNRICTDYPIDLTDICNTKLRCLDTKLQRHFGFHLTEEGADIFTAKINIEIQYASEAVIAAVEKAGGIITTRYYDLYSVEVKSNPLKFFYTGLPIPKCKLPPQDAIEYYSSAENRGYLCDVSKLAYEREKLAQKYGYNLPDNGVTNDFLFKMKKDPRQIFYDLEPGWVVNMMDGEILIPEDEKLSSHYSY